MPSNDYKTVYHYRCPYCQAQRDQENDDMIPACPRCGARMKLIGYNKSPLLTTEITEKKSNKDNKDMEVSHG